MSKLYYKAINSMDLLVILALCILGYFISTSNFLIFHTLTELITIVIGFAVMLIAVGTTKICDNYYFTYLGIAYGFIGVIDLLHTFTYRGITIITSDIDVSKQLWIAGRYYECIILFVSILFIDRKVRVNRLVVINVVSTAAIFISILCLKIFPACYIKGYGNTTFKVASELIVCLMFLLFQFVVIRYKQFRKIKEYRGIVLAMGFKVISEFTFIFIGGIYDYANFIGHITKFISFYILYKALFKSVILNPYSVLFKNINMKAAELQRKNDELALAKLNLENDFSHNQRLIEFLPDGMLVTEDRIITYANEQLCSMFGIENKNEIVGKSIFEILDYPYHEELLQNIKTRKKRNLIEPAECVVNFNGHKLEVEISTLIMDENNDTQSSVSVIRDISDRKRAEQMEMLLNEKEKEENFKNEFFATISHELRTPINVIYSAIQLENSNLNNQDISFIKKYNNVVKQNCLRLIRITNNIIDTTKIQADFFKPVAHVQDIVNIVEEVTLSVINYANLRKISVTFDTEDEEIYVNCDKSLIERIMLNLLSNSVKYGRLGGNIKVNICRADDGFVKISIEDDGIGIPKEAISKLFNRFERVDKSISRGSEGSGIGLYLVKAFVEMQKGTVSMNSEVDKGTQIILSFPVVEAAEEICAHDVQYKSKQENVFFEKTDIEFSDIYMNNYELEDYETSTVNKVCSI